MERLITVLLTLAFMVSTFSANYFGRPILEPLLREEASATSVLDITLVGGLTLLALLSGGLVVYRAFKNKWW